MFDSSLVDELRLGPKEYISDLDAAYCLAQLAYNQLEAFQTRGSVGLYGGLKLLDEDLSVVLRTRALLVF